METAVKTHITRDDVVRGGACVDGVNEWADEFAGSLTVMPVAGALRLARDDDERMHIARGANADGYGYGYGYGYGKQP